MKFWTKTLNFSFLSLRRCVICLYRVWFTLEVWHNWISNKSDVTNKQTFNLISTIQILLSSGYFNFHSFFLLLPQFPCLLVCGSITRKSTPLSPWHSNKHIGDRAPSLSPSSWGNPPAWVSVSHVPQFPVGFVLCVVKSYFYFLSLYVHTCQEGWAVGEIAPPFSATNEARFPNL